MEAVGTLGCPRCGAPTSPDAVRCAHCGTPLALVACPACFARVFQGSRHCSHCGAEAARAVAVDERAPRPCPRCRQSLVAVQVGRTALDECPRCGGVWADTAAFELILKDAEVQADILGAARAVPAPQPGAPQPYVPCPACARLMNRLNFARCSGVLVDACKGHGLWFDRDELRQIVAFVRDGGLARARRNEREDLDLARRRLHEQEARTRAAASASVLTASASSSSELDAEFVIGAVDAVATVGSALWDWLRD